MGRPLAFAMIQRLASRTSFPDTVNIGGWQYPLGFPQAQPSLGFRQEEIRDTFTDFARLAAMNPAVFALMEARRELFSQGWFRFQQVRNGVPGEFFGTPALDILDGPGRADSSQDLMSQAIQDADIAGTAVIVREAGSLVCLRPDWCTIIAASRRYPEQGAVAPDAQVVGVAYYPGGKYGGAEPIMYLPGEFTLFRYSPDPLFRFKGVSWIKPVLQEVLADSAATIHKTKFFENGATPSTVVTIPANTPELFDKWVDKFEKGHKGAANAYRTIYLSAGSDVEVVGANLRQIDFKATQGAGESRLAAAARVPPIIAGFSEGLASATYSNYGQARRAFSDMCMWDLWGKMSNALESLIPPPAGSRMWMDKSQIPFLQEDQKDAAEVANTNATAINTYVTAGFEPASAVSAVSSGDVSRLKHTGKVSVQLQDPNAKPEPPAPPPDMMPPTDQQAQVAKARSVLIERGIVRPTQAQVADELGVSERTVQRWMSPLVV